jgi:hypothetical protein
MLREVTAARAALLAACAVVFLLACADEQDQSASSRTPTIAFHSDPNSPTFGAVDVSPFDASEPEREWPRLLVVYTGDRVPAPGSALPLLGRYTRLGDTLRFVPRFPPVPGQSYIAHYRGSLEQVLQVPRTPAAATAFVDRVYPTANRLPMNLLRMYIHFSAPMSVGQSGNHVRLLDAEGKTVEDAFLTIAQQELWDPEHRRLTLLFDPGRIKRGIRPNEELGLALLEGRSYTLVIDSAFRDAQGNPLKQSFERHFSVGPEDRSLPQTKDWRVQPPAVNTRTALTIQFPESLDRALLDRLLVVKRAGQAIDGVVAVSDGETRWTFVPNAPWQAGDYVIEVGTDLEDLAGNNLRDLFDVDRKARQPAGVSGDRVDLRFTVQ